MSKVLALVGPYTEDGQILRESAEGAGWKVERVNSADSLKRLNVGNAQIVPYGDPRAMPGICSQLGIPEPESVPLVYLDTVPRDFVPIDLRTMLATYMTFEDFPFWQEHQKWHIESVSVKSCFHAGEYTYEEFKEAVKDLGPNDLCQLMLRAWEPIPVRKVHRAFVCHRRIESIQPLYYGDGGKKKARRFLESFLTDHRVKNVPPMAVDVGFTAKGLTLLRTYAAWHAPVGTCEPETVLEVLRQSTIPPRRTSTCPPKVARHKALAKVAARG